MQIIGAQMSRDVYSEMALQIDGLRREIAQAQQERDELIASYKLTIRHLRQQVVEAKTIINEAKVALSFNKPAIWGAWVRAADAFDEKV